MSSSSDSGLSSFLGVATVSASLDDIAWHEIRDLRSRQYATLGLTGAIHRLARLIIYVAEGETAKVEVMKRILMGDHREPPLRPLWTGEIPCRGFGLVAPVGPALLRAEVSWLTEELDRPEPDVSTLYACLTWIALSQEEAARPPEAGRANRPH